MRRFVGSAILNLDTDPSFVVSSLGNINDTKGMDRLREIVGSSVSIEARTKGDITSFQRVIHPLLYLVTRTSFSESPLSEFKRNAFRILKDKILFVDVSDMVRNIVSKNQIHEVSPEDDCWHAKTWFDFVEPLVKFSELCLREFDDLRHDTKLHYFVFSVLPELMDSLNVIDRRRIEHSLQHSTQIIESVRNKENRKPAVMFQYVRHTRVHPAVKVELAGSLHSSGEPRNDNDFADFTKICVAPTVGEVFSKISPYVPKNNGIYPHHLPVGFERHIDTHFRLLRFDLVMPLIEGLKHLNADKKKLLGPSGHLIRETEGFSCKIYRNAKIEAISCARKFSFEISIEHKKQSHEYWKNSKQFQYASLVCLWFVHAVEPQIIFCTIMDRSLDKLMQAKPRLNVCPCSKEGTRLLLKEMEKNSNEIVLLTSFGSFFAYRPILEALKQVAHLPIRLKNYLSASPQKNIDSPIYLSEGQTLDFSVLLLPESRKNPQVKRFFSRVDVSRFPFDLEEHTTLDRAQVAALHSALTKELVLIQGPPGTGKTYVGIEMVKLLLANKENLSGISPIVCVCYTNHALDQFLEGLLDSGIDNIVRIGGRSQSEKLKDKGLVSLIKDSTTPHDRYLFSTKRKPKDKLRGEIEGISRKMTTGRLTWEDLKSIIEWENPEIFESFSQQNKPYKSFLKWLRPSNKKGRRKEKNIVLENPFELLGQEENFAVADWVIVCSSKKRRKGQCRNVLGEAKDIMFKNEEMTSEKIKKKCKQCKSTITRGMYIQREKIRFKNKFNGEMLEYNSWVEKKDIYGEEESEGEDEVEDLGFWHKHGTIWTMEKARRLELYHDWVNTWKELNFHKLESDIAAFESVSDELETIDSSSKLRILKNADIVGLTTSGMALNQQLLTALGAKIVVCEEAAEVLEAHIMACLTPDTSHLIMIGDHLQLRPKVEVYDFEKVSGKGYDLDVSLFERLIDNGFPVTTLSTQWRMRPEIADLARITLYPNLLDSDTVKNYSSVKGMQSNLWFYSHNQVEDNCGKGISSTTKINRFEVEMIVELCHYLLKQGYPPGDVTILTPYLGQLMAIRKALSKVTHVYVGERDVEDIEQELDDEEDVKELFKDSEIQRGKLIDFVRVSTVDNFQGEESEIILISLVRNNPQGKLGFLKIANRINVMLTRAKKAMYIIGAGNSQARRL